MRRSIYLAMTAGVLAAVGLGAFGAARLMRGAHGSPLAVAQPAPPGPPVPPSPTPPAVVPTNLSANPDTTKPNWYVPYLNADRVKPTFDQTINGITVGPSAQHRFSVVCQPGTAQQIPVEQVNRTAAAPVLVAAKYLPAGAVRFQAVATVCEAAGNRQAVLGVDAGFSIPSDPKTGRRGGIVTVSRWLGAPSATVSIPAERWAAGTVAGHPAAIARPILANGLGQSAIVVHANGVTTKVQAAWLTLDEVRRIAEGLFR